MSGQYRTIVVDPPWMLHRPSGWHGASCRPLAYPTLSVATIEALPVGEMSTPVAHLYLWTVNRHVESAYRVARAWGFKPGTLLTWCKEPRGMGPGGHYATTTEFVLFCRRGIEGKNPKVREPTSWFQWPRAAHSVKPEAFLDMVERVSPGPYAELFARRARFGWDYPIGDQALGGIAA